MTACTRRTALTVEARKAAATVQVTAGRGGILCPALPDEDSHACWGFHGSCPAPGQGSIAQSFLRLWLGKGCRLSNKVPNTEVRLSVIHAAVQRKRCSSEACPCLPKRWTMDPSSQMLQPERRALTIYGGYASWQTGKPLTAPAVEEAPGAKGRSCVRQWLRSCSRPCR